MGHQPTAQQAALFTDIATGEGHTLVTARAGAGKTSSLIDGLAHVPPGLRALLVAYNKRIAEELAGRVAARSIKSAEVSTAHSFGFRAVGRALRPRLVKDRVSLLIGETMRIEEREQADALVKVVSFAKQILARTPAEIEEAIVRSDVDLGVVESTDRFVDRVIALLDDCERCEDGRIDFDDMVWLPLVRDLRVPQYDRVFIDETQDFNRAQLELAIRACKPGGRICAVGDDRQSIYGFRGADRDAIPNIRRRLEARDLSLSVTFRCARSIVDVAREIVPDLEAAPNAEEGIVRDATDREMLRDAAPGDFILSRSNAPLVSYCLAFLRAGKRAAIEGKKIGDSLISWVKRMKAKSVEDLRGRIDRWLEAEIRRIEAKRGDPTAAEERAETVLAISDGAETIAQVIERLETLFADKAEGASEGVILLSSTHKAKGLERDRVWVLASTYRKRPSVEEDNLWYVAVTRAKRELVFVTPLRGPGEVTKRYAAT